MAYLEAKPSILANLSEYTIEALGKPADAIRIDLFALR
jgi:hypothetical protein